MGWPRWGPLNMSQCKQQTLEEKNHSDIAVEKMTH